MNKTIVYIDGFNLYYGLAKNTGYKWLDIIEFCKKVFPKNNIVKVKYFTALVDGDSDPNSPIRQQTYWNALESLYPGMIEIIKGHFRTDPKRRPIAFIQDKQRENIRLQKTASG